MGFLGSLSRKLGFSMDDADERGTQIEENELQDEEEYEDEEEEDSAPRFSFTFSNPFKRSAGRDEDDEEEDDEPQPVRRREREEPQARSRRGNVIHDARMGAQEPQYAHCERIVVVRQIEECRDIIRYLLDGESVMLNLENVDPKDCGRVVDLLSGAAFALQGRMLKVAHLSYLLAPENVEVIEADIYGGAPRYR